MATLQEGDSDADVVTLQNWLVELGHLTAVSGHYDDATVEAVTRFQSDHGLPATGQCDEDTWQWIDWAAHEGAPVQVAEVPHPETATLAPGDMNPRVVTLQGWLAELGYQIAVTGYYDDATVDSVRRFQSAHGLPSTGECDYDTWQWIDSAAAQRRAEPRPESRPTGFGDTSSIPTPWGPLVYPAPTSYPFAAELDDLTKASTKSFDRAHQTAEERVALGGYPHRVEEFLAHHEGTFAAEVLANQSEEAQESGERMETQRQLVETINTQLKQIEGDLAEAREDLDAALLELAGARHAEQARQLAEELEKWRRKVDHGLELTKLAVSLVTTAATLENPLEVLEAATEAFTTVVKLGPAPEKAQQVAQAQDAAVRAEIDAAAKRIDSAERRIGQAKTMARPAVATSRESLEFYGQLRDRAEADYDESTRGSFRFADLESLTDFAEAGLALTGRLVLETQSALDHTEALVGWYESAINHAMLHDQADDGGVDRFRESQRTATAIRDAQSTAHGRVLTEGENGTKLVERLVKMRQDANYALSRHQVRPGG